MKKVVLPLFILFLYSILFGADEYLYDIKVMEKDPALGRVLKSVDVWSWYEDDEGFDHYRAVAGEKGAELFKGLSVEISIVRKIEDFPKKLRYSNLHLYHTPQQVVDELDAIEDQFPNIAKVFKIGETYEGRDIRAIKLSTSGENNNLEKEEVFFAGMHHSREWISMEVPLALARFVAEGYYTNSRIRKMVEKMEIWISPVVNPDGHDYTWKGDSIRYKNWRKNRRPFKKTSWGIERTYYGIDPNRNYDIVGNPDGSNPDGEWIENNNYDGETYNGEKPFSDAEASSIRDFVEFGGPDYPYQTDAHKLADNVKGFLSYHNFSQLILYPYGQDHTKSPLNDMMAEIAEKMAQLIDDENEGWPHNGEHFYEPKKSSDLYPSDGDASDWFHTTYAHDALTSFLIELRPKGSAEGFYLNGELIDDVIRENIPPALYYIEYLISGNPTIDTDKNDNGTVDYFEKDIDEEPSDGENVPDEDGSPTIDDSDPNLSDNDSNDPEPAQDSGISTEKNDGEELQDEGSDPAEKGDNDSMSDQNGREDEINEDLNDDPSGSEERDGDFSEIEDPGHEPGIKRASGCGCSILF